MHTGKSKGTGCEVGVGAGWWRSVEVGLEGSEQGESRRGGQRGDGWGVRADCGGPHGLYSKRSGELLVYFGGELDKFVNCVLDVI